MVAFSLGLRRALRAGLGLRVIRNVGRAHLHERNDAADAAHDAGNFSRAAQ